MRLVSLQTTADRRLKKKEIILPKPAEGSEDISSHFNRYLEQIVDVKIAMCQPEDGEAPPTNPYKLLYVGAIF